MRTDKHLILNSNISNAIRHREAARIAAKRAETAGNLKQKKSFEKETKEWQEKIDGWREELKLL